MGLGLIRKALFVMTGGLSRFVFKDNANNKGAAKAAAKRATPQRPRKATRPKRQATGQRQPQSQRASKVAKASKPGSGTASELERLATLHRQGALTSTEFASAKAKILGTSTTAQGPSEREAPYPSVEANVTAARHLAGLAGGDRDESLASFSRD
jgi:hypothetical protein